MVVWASACLHMALFAAKFTSIPTDHSWLSWLWLLYLYRLWMWHGSFSFIRRLWGRLYFKDLSQLWLKLISCRWIFYLHFVCLSLRLTLHNFLVIEVTARHHTECICSFIFFGQQVSKFRRDSLGLELKFELFNLLFVFRHTLDTIFLQHLSSEETLRKA